SLGAARNNLPQMISSFVGRTSECAEVANLLAENRLVTLTGPGGIGKTRLSTQVASHVLDLFPDGVWFVELATLADPGFVPTALASAAGVREEQGRPVLETLRASLERKRILFVLDNCEHVVERSAVTVG